MRPTYHIPLRLLAAFGVLLLSQAAAQSPDNGPWKEIGRTTEKEMKVVLSTSFGNVSIAKGEPEKMVVAQSTPGHGGPGPMNIDYSIRNRIGYMDIELGEDARGDEGSKSGFKLAHFNSGTWYLKFSDAVPISFDIQLGVGKGNFEFAGLQIKDLNLSTGAAEVRLSFNDPNQSSIDNLNIESGVSTFEGRNLGNANFKRFRFQGGLGSYTLDFSGEINREVDVDVEIGVGVCTIIVPPGVGARIAYEKSWVSRLDYDTDFHSSGENEYLSDNYADAVSRMNIRINSGMGSIRVRRR
jgi:hypothetical protein